MGFFKGYKTKTVCNKIELNSNSLVVWNEITNVMINKLRFPIYLSVLGIPKPVKATVIQEGVGGYRVAHFSNDAEFQQEILEWSLHKKYRFSFNASDNFKVGHVMKLSKGPFRINTGGYELHENQNGLTLVLSSDYRLNGLFGYMLHLPFRMIIYHFQKYLLRAIRVNCERP